MRLGVTLDWSHVSNGQDHLRSWYQQFTSSDTWLDETTRMHLHSEFEAVKPQEAYSTKLVLHALQTMVNYHSPLRTAQLKGCMPTIIQLMWIHLCMVAKVCYLRSDSNNVLVLKKSFLNSAGYRRLWDPAATIFFCASLSGSKTCISICFSFDVTAMTSYIAQIVEALLDYEL